MAGVNAQKRKLLCLEQIFRHSTDENHGRTFAELQEELAAYGCTEDRKTFYDDLEELRSAGLDIVAARNGKRHEYYLGSRDFELPELKLLVDSVQASRFITEKKSRELIRKLGGLTSSYHAAELNRQVYLSGQSKADNESIYYNVDEIYRAINANRKIEFQYMAWDLTKNLVPRRNGKQYCISPWALIWDNENYYMVGFDSEAADENGQGIFKHYRVDKMKKIRLAAEERDGAEEFAGQDMRDYARKCFHMFGGDAVSVSLRAEKSMIGVILDRFGRSVQITPDGPDHFKVRVDVVPSDQFIGWVFSLRGKIKVIGPEDVVDDVKRMAETLAEQYREED